MSGEKGKWMDDLVRNRCSAFSLSFKIYCRDVGECELWI